MVVATARLPLEIAESVSKHIAGRKKESFQPKEKVSQVESDITFKL